jgi:hypothetical protein
MLHKMSLRDKQSIELLEKRRQLIRNGVIEMQFRGKFFLVPR